MTKRIAVDFDGVICERFGIPRGREWVDSKPMEYANEAIDHLIRSGFEIYVFTNRPQKEWKKIENWLYRWCFPTLKITNKKLPNTLAYIDDRAIRFTSWLDVTKYFS